MPNNAETDGQSTMPLVSVADGRAVVRLNRPREHNRLEPADLAFPDLPHHLFVFHCSLR